MLISKFFLFVYYLLEKIFILKKPVAKDQV